MSTTRCLLFFFIWIFFHAVEASLSLQETQRIRKRVYSPWNFSAFSFLHLDQEENSKGGGRVESYNYVSVNYRLFQDQRLSLRFPFTYSTAGYDSFYREKRQNPKLLFQDPFLSYMVYDVLLLPFDIGMSWEGRLYLPVNRYSRDTGLRGRIRSDMYFSKRLTHFWEIEYVNKLNYYAQSQHVVGQIGVDSVTGRERVYIVATKKFFFNHWVSIWYKFKPLTGLGFRVGSEEIWYHQSKVLSRENHYAIKFGPQLRVSLSDNANFILSFEHSINSLKDFPSFGRLFTGPKTSGSEIPRHRLQWALLSFIRF